MRPYESLILGEKIYKKQISKIMYCQLVVWLQWRLTSLTCVISGTLVFPGGSDGRVCRGARDLGLISGSGRFPGEGNGNPLQYSCLENPMDSGARGAIVHKVAKRQTWLSDSMPSPSVMLLFLCLLILNLNPVLKFSLTLFLPLKSYDSFHLIFHLDRHFLLQNL